MINITEQAKQKMLSILDDEGATLVRFGLKVVDAMDFNILLLLKKNKKKMILKFH